MSDLMLLARRAAEALDREAESNEADGFDHSAHELRKLAADLRRAVEEAHEAWVMTANAVLKAEDDERRRWYAALGGDLEGLAPEVVAQRFISREEAARVAEAAEGDAMGGGIKSPGWNTACHEIARRLREGGKVSR